MGWIHWSKFYTLFSKIGFKGHVLNLDSLTYAGDLKNLAGIENKTQLRIYARRYSRQRLFKLCFTKNEIDTVVHFAAESHVDNSISGPRIFAETNVMGTFELLTAARTTGKKTANTKKAFTFTTFQLTKFTAR